MGKNLAERRGCVEMTHETESGAASEEMTGSRIQEVEEAGGWAGERGWGGALG